MSARQLDLDPYAPPPGMEESAVPGDTPSALKLQAAARLAAHRARRGRAALPELPGLDLPPRPQTGTRAARIAAAVADRYAHSPSYRAFLAAEAERAIHQAEAAAEVAARTAKAIVATQQQLLSELDQFDSEANSEASPREDPQYETPQPALTLAEPAPRPTPALTIRLYEDVSRAAITGTPNAMPLDPLHDEERLALDDEIAFRKAPTFEPAPEPAVPLPANLIEFPRQLVAARKARPRIAEGPLREDATPAPEGSQLRIFEVEPDQIAAPLIPDPEPALPEWSSIRLGAAPLPETTFNMAAHREDFIAAAPVLLTAPMGLRLMAATVDACLILATFLGFVTVVAKTARQLPTGPTAALGAAGSLAALALLYQLLFFTFSDATPGMRYARIGLCTFSDDNPTRAAMRRRLIAILLAACPAGLGLIWAFLDDDRLGWHDRISRMYQRSY